MEWLFLVLLAGLISCTNGVNDNGTFTDEEQKQCVGKVITSYIRVEFPDHTVLNGTNKGTVLQNTTYGQNGTPSIVAPHMPGKPYTLIFFCVDTNSTACAQEEVLRWHLRNVIDLKFDQATVVIEYNPATEKNQTCVFFFGQQAQTITSGATHQTPQKTNITKLTEDDGLTFLYDNYFRTEIIEPPPQLSLSPPPCKKPCPPKDKCKTKSILPSILSKLCLF